MKSVLACAGGASLGISFVLITGALSVQVIGNEAGAAFDLSNTVVGIVAPRLPILPSLAIAALAALLIALLSFQLWRGGKSAQWFVISFSTSTLALICWAFYLTSGRIDGGGVPVGVLKGWKGWLEEGGRNPATHLVVLLSIMPLWLKIGRPTRRIDDDNEQRIAI